jgi:hypothetical protein
MAVSNLKFGFLCCLAGFAAFSVIAIARAPNPSVAGNVPAQTDTPDAPSPPTVIAQPRQLRSARDPACHYDSDGFFTAGDIVNCPDSDPDSEAQRRMQWDSDHDDEIRALAHRKVEQACDNLRAIDPDAWRVSYGCQHL